MPNPVIVHCLCGDNLLSNNTASNVRENLFVPSIKYVWARQGSHVGATAHQAELLQRPSNDDNCVWVKWENLST